VAKTKITLTKSVEGGGWVAGEEVQEVRERCAEKTSRRRMMSSKEF
jgi:hypothetical protein